ncbi:hypothetical protein AB9F45_26120 [Rhizobium leguminosarum]|uniref:hypothetical protein n=1 Tax=Rhizobium leguminosarum TaxID=384 RepID=UPI003F943E45
MEINQDQIDSLIRAPSESLNVEIKRWIDLSTPEGQAKIIKGCLALRNRNGGFFVIGFDDETLQPDVTHQPENPRQEFHVDRVQALISKYAQELFEVGVAFSTRDGVDFPVIVVPTGIQVPVAAKYAFPGGGGKPLFAEGSVYFRTLNANGIPSTSIAHPRDWREIVEICFENREADIARFFRRQLSGLDRTTLGEALLQLGFVGNAPASPPLPSLRQGADAFFDIGHHYFQKALAKRELDAKAKAMADGLTWEVALVVDPELRQRTPDNEFLGEVLGSNPQYTGWPVWTDTRSFRTEYDRPIRVENGWDALVAMKIGWSNHLDFWHVEPSRFYLRRALEDDLSEKVSPGTVLNPLFVILRVAEAIAVGLAVANTLSGEADQEMPERRLGFSFKWTKLGNRRLHTWGHPTVMMIGSPQSHVDEVSTFVEVPLDTPTKAIAPYVDEATRELFATFDGERIPPHVIDHWTQKLLDRQL